MEDHDAARSQARPNAREVLEDLYVRVFPVDEDEIIALATHGFPHVEGSHAAGEGDVPALLLRDALSQEPSE